MPTSHRPRPAPCSQCGDTVLIAEATPRALLRWRAHAPGTARAKTTITLEHADPGPDGELFDAVDEGCRRPRVR